MILIGDWFDTGVPPESGGGRQALIAAIAISVALPLLLISPLLGPLATAVCGLASILLFMRNVSVSAGHVVQRSFCVQADVLPDWMVRREILPHQFHSGRLSAHSQWLSFTTAPNR
jgi:hypothetical protein